MDKEPDNGDMVVKLFKERQCLTDKSAHPLFGPSGTFWACPLAQGTVETFEVLDAFAVAVMPVAKDNRLVSGP